MTQAVDGINCGSVVRWGFDAMPKLRSRKQNMDPHLRRCGSRLASRKEGHDNPVIRVSLHVSQRSSPFSCLEGPVIAAPTCKVLLDSPGLPAESRHRTFDKSSDTAMSDLHLSASGACSRLPFGYRAYADHACNAATRARTSQSWQPHRSDRHQVHSPIGYFNARRTVAHSLDL
jgi:hypothetical protein